MSEVEARPLNDVDWKGRALRPRRLIEPLLFGRMARRKSNASAINILIIAARDGTAPYAGTPPLVVNLLKLTWLELEILPDQARSEDFTLELKPREPRRWRRSPSCP